LGDRSTLGVRSVRAPVPVHVYVAVIVATDVASVVITNVQPSATIAADRFRLRAGLSGIIKGHFVSPPRLRLAPSVLFASRLARSSQREVIALCMRTIGIADYSPLTNTLH
jgi:hypothetical protein